MIGIDRSRAIISSMVHLYEMGNISSMGYYEGLICSAIFVGTLGLGISEFMSSAYAML